jgi:hypothetical protein
MKTLSEPIRADLELSLQLLLKRIKEVRPAVEKGGYIYSRIVGNTSKLAGFLSGAQREIEEILHADGITELLAAEQRAAREAL